MCSIPLAVTGRRVLNIPSDFDGWRRSITLSKLGLGTRGAAWFSMVSPVSLAQSGSSSNRYIESSSRRPVQDVGTVFQFLVKPLLFVRFPN